MSIENEFTEPKEAYSASEITDADTNDKSLAFHHDPCSESGGTAGTTDDPPVGGGSGSFYFDIPDIIKLRFDGMAEVYPSKVRGKDPVRYFKYKIETTNEYSSVGVLKVLTEKNNGDVSHRCFSMPKEMEAKIKIWLVSDKPEQDTKLDDFPDAIVDGREKGQIYTRKELVETTHPYKKKRQKRWFYESSNRPHLRIMKWQIVAQASDANGHDSTQFVQQSADHDMFYLHIYFHHPHRSGTYRSETETKPE